MLSTKDSTWANNYLFIARPVNIPYKAWSSLISLSCTVFVIFRYELTKAKMWIGILVHFKRHKICSHCSQEFNKFCCEDAVHCWLKKKSRHLESLPVVMFVYLYCIMMLIITTCKQMNCHSKYGNFSDINVMCSLSPTPSWFVACRLARLVGYLQVTVLSTEDTH